MKDFLNREPVRNRMDIFNVYVCYDPEAMELGEKVLDFLDEHCKIPVTAGGTQEYWTRVLRKGRWSAVFFPTSLDALDIVRTQFKGPVVGYGPQEPKNHHYERFLNTFRMMTEGSYRVRFKTELESLLK